VKKQTRSFGHTKVSGFSHGNRRRFLLWSMVVAFRAAGVCGAWRNWHPQREALLQSRGSSSVQVPHFQGKVCIGYKQLFDDFPHLYPHGQLACVFMKAARYWRDRNDEHPITYDPYKPSISVEEAISFHAQLFMIKADNTYVFWLQDSFSFKGSAFSDHLHFKNMYFLALHYRIRLFLACQRVEEAYSIFQPPQEAIKHSSTTELGLPKSAPHSLPPSPVSRLSSGFLRQSL